MERLYRLALSAVLLSIALIVMGVGVGGEFGELLSRLGTVGLILGIAAIGLVLPAFQLARVALRRR